MVHLQNGTTSGAGMPHRLSTWSQPVLFGGPSICIDKTRVFVLITLDDSMAFPVHLLRTPLLMMVYVFLGRHITYLQLQLILRATAKKTKQDAPS